MTGVTNSNVDQFTGQLLSPRISAKGLEDFSLMKLIGDGSYSHVYLAKLKNANIQGDKLEESFVIKQVFKDRSQPDFLLSEKVSKFESEKIGLILIPRKLVNV